MNKILVTGGTGAVGSVLVKRLRENGVRVRILTIPGDPLICRIEDPEVEICYGDIANEEQLDGVFDGITTVLHCAAIIITKDDSLYEKINTIGTRNVVRKAKKSGVKHFIHISSASVVYRRSTPYSESKKMAERMVKSSGLQWTIVRPTLVYGYRGGQEFDMFLDYLKKFPVIPFIGEGNAKKRPVFVEDLIDGLLKLTEWEYGNNKIYNFSGASVISMIDFAKLCLVLLQQEQKKLIIIPVWMCKVAAAILKKLMKDPPLKWSVIAGIIQDADLDPAEAIQDLGYHPSDIMKKLPECFPRTA